MVEKQNSGKRPVGFTHSTAGVRNEMNAADDLTANEQTLWWNITVFLQEKKRAGLNINKLVNELSLTCRDAS